MKPLHFKLHIWCIFYFITFCHVLLIWIHEVAHISACSLYFVKRFSMYILQVFTKVVCSTHSFLSSEEYHSENSLFRYWFILYLQTALLHHNRIILYLRTCSNSIGSFSNSMKACSIVIGPFSTSEQTCTSVMRPFSANEFASSWLGPFFSLLWQCSKMSLCVFFAEYLYLFSFPYPPSCLAFCFVSRLWLTHLSLRAEHMNNFLCQIWPHV